MVPWIFTKWLQDRFNATLLFQMPDEDHSVYGAYAVSISATGLSTVRKFEFIPFEDLRIKGELNEPINILNWHVNNNGNDIKNIIKITNELNAARNLRQIYLWDNMYFVNVPSYLTFNASSVKVYDLSSEDYPENFSDANLTGWLYSGDVLNISRSDFYKLNEYSMNATINFSTGNATFSKNFTTPLNFTINSTQLKDLHIVMYLPDINLQNISIKLMTNSSNYYIN